LQRTIDSVTAQDYPHIEYIIVDGKSKDTTMNLVQAAGSAIHKVVSEPDKGLYDAMNKGLAMATGDYVLFLNAGDELADGHVLSAVFELPAADVYYGQAMLVNLDGKSLGLRKPLPPEKLNWKSLQWGMNVCHQAFIIRRDKAVSYDLQYRICADIDWMIRSLKQCETTAKTEGLVCLFLIDGLSSTQRKKAWKERYVVLSRQYGWLNNLLNHLYIVLRYPFKRR
jgi:glycosyltransferase involved in cell wall biosynthesis